MQTDYSNMASAYAGMLGDAAFTDKISRVASEDINWGRGVVIASDNTVSLPTGPSDTFVGVACQRMKPKPNDTGIALYEQYDEVTILRKGRVWVYSEQAVDPTKDVYMRTGDAYQGQYPGNFRTDDDNDSHPLTLQITNAKWATKTTAAGLALLELNLP